MKEGETVSHRGPKISKPQDVEKMMDFYWGSSLRAVKSFLLPDESEQGCFVSRTHGPSLVWSAPPERNWMEQNV